MKSILAVLALACASCHTFDRVTFSVGYDKATIGADLYLRDPKNPIASQRHSGK